MIAHCGVYLLGLESAELLKEDTVLDKTEAQKDAQGATTQEDKPTSKKPFVEPEISVPIDVLEATTFAPAISSGSVAP